MIRPVEKRNYQIPMSGHSGLHEELAWYATEDDKVIGVVIRDRIDNDYSWVVLTQNDQGPGYTAIDIAASLPSEAKATSELHGAMEQASE